MIIYLHEFEKEFYGVVISKTGKTSFVEYSILSDKSGLVPGINTSLNHLRTVDYSYIIRHYRYWTSKASFQSTPPKEKVIFALNTSIGFLILKINSITWAKLLLYLKACNDSFYNIIVQLLILHELWQKVQLSHSYNICNHKGCLTLRVISVIRCLFI